MAINSRRKGKMGELQAVKYLKSLGFTDAKRTAQYNGKGRGDVECPESLPGLNIEVKYGYNGRSFKPGSKLLAAACAQAARDSADGWKWVVLWKPKYHKQWKITYITHTTMTCTPTISDDATITGTLRYVCGRPTQAIPAAG